MDGRMRAAEKWDGNAVFGMPDVKKTSARILKGWIGVG